MVPNVPPTGRNVKIPLVAIVRFAPNRDGEWKVAHEHLYWDQASVLHQLGVLDPASFSLPLDVTGQAQADKALDPKSHPSNELLMRACGCEGAQCRLDEACRADPSTAPKTEL
mmetsp:Transcript_18649/g.35201  ORF Transcript_18649/g.35201 Transcript_18649/m.35201 type:complete len:113 (+) Transcript_18649:418-756(+)